MATYRIDNLPGHIDFEGKGYVARILQNAKNLLMTRMGEIPYDRLRGFDPALFDLPIAKMQEALVPEVDRVMRWEPDVLVVDAECRLGAGNETVIEVLLEIDA